MGTRTPYLFTTTSRKWTLQHIPFIFFWGELFELPAWPRKRTRAQQICAEHIAIASADHAQMWHGRGTIGGSCAASRAIIPSFWSRNLFLFRNGAVDHHDHTSFLSMPIFQEPKLEVPTIYKAYFSGLYSHRPYVFRNYSLEQHWICP